MGSPGAERAQEPDERVRVLEQVVDAGDARVLERHPAAAGRAELGGGVHHLGQGIATVDRDHGVAQLVVRRVERDRQRDRQALGREPADARHDPDGRNRDVPGGESEVAVEPFDGGPRGVVVREWFAHPHEHDVVHRLGGRVRGADDLLDDLAGLEMAHEAGLARRAERATHRAPGLAGDAHGGPGRVAHQDGLDLGVVRPRPPQPLHRLAVVTRRLDDRVQRQAGTRRRPRCAAPAGATTRPRAGRAGGRARPRSGPRGTAAPPVPAIHAASSLTRHRVPGRHAAFRHPRVGAVGAVDLEAERRGTARVRAGSPRRRRASRSGSDGRG